jgi:peptidyl-prolyl cis-trans isomerase A (cyclophilin A)
MTVGGIRERLLALLVLAPLFAGATSCSSRRENPLLSASDAEITRAAPDSFRVRFETSRGPFTVVARRAWAPHGVDRFYFLTKNHYYDSTYFFRVVEGFVVQFGISGDPSVNSVWHSRQIPDDSVRHSNTRGTLSFASQGPNTRTVQLFINLVDNPKLDAFGGGFPPIGEVVSGMAVVDSLYSGYGEGPPRGLGPRQDMMMEQGNPYVRRGFPKLDLVRSATVEQEWR